jgi:hypothetical protein
MSYSPGDMSQKTQNQVLWKKAWIIFAVAFALLAIELALYTYKGGIKISDVAGGVTIEAEPDTRIYIGDKLAGTTQVSFTWQEVFGDENNQPIAKELPNASSPITPELISGPGASKLESERTVGFRDSSETIRDSGTNYLMRRANGDLDQAIGIIIDWDVDPGPDRHYLLVVRLRKGLSPSKLYFTQSFGQTLGHGSPIRKVLGLSSNEVTKVWRFSAGQTPKKFAEEIETKGLWEPVVGK